MLVLLGLFAAACGPKVRIVEVTRVVTVDKPVEKIVQETVIVERTVIAEKRTEVQVQVTVVVTPTPLPTPTPTAIPVPSPTPTQTPPPNAVVDICKEAGPQDAVINPRKDYIVFHCLVSVTNQPVAMKALNIWKRGTLERSKLSNFRLSIDGVAQSRQIDPTGYRDCVTDEDVMNKERDNVCLQGMRFEITRTLPVGMHLIEVVVDIAPGASGTFTFSMRGPSSGDLDVRGTQTIAFITVGGSSAQGVRTGEQTVR